MKLPLNATTVPNLDRALRAIPRHALERFADRVFTLLYLECEHPKSEMEVNPDKEWTQDTIEEVDSALREILKEQVPSHLKHYNIDGRDSRQMRTWGRVEEPHRIIEAWNIKP